MVQVKGGVMSIEQGLLTETSSQQTQIHPYLGGTVLQMMAEHSNMLTLDRMPPQTPPTPFPTHTRSGEGFATISDDADQEFLYE